MGRSYIHDRELRFVFVHVKDGPLSGGPSSSFDLLGNSSIGSCDLY